MREIKFRAWSKRMTMMFPNELMVEAGRQLVIFAKRMKPDLPDQENAKGGLLLPTDDDDLIFMQYTGLNDRNGKEIYEGEILDYCTYIYRNERRKGIVCFDEEGAKYKIVPFESFKLNAKNGGFTGHVIDKHIALLSRCLGNIHENPELMES